MLFMAAQSRHITLKYSILLIWVYVILFIEVGSIRPVSAESLLSCDSNSREAYGYQCNPIQEQNQCSTFALFFANSYYSSLSNLSNYFGFNRTGITEASNLTLDTEFLWRNQPLLIPISCTCNGSFFQARAIKTSIQGETFTEIAESLEGLTSCKAIIENNPNLSPWYLEAKVQLQVPLRCSCPTVAQINEGTRLLVSYPIQEGDTVFNLAASFNISIEVIASANNISGDFESASLITNSTLLIPLENKPVISQTLKTREPKSIYTSSSIPFNIAENSARRDIMWKIDVYVSVSAFAVVVSLTVTAAILVIQWRKKLAVHKTRDLELQEQKTSTLDPVEHLEELQDPSSNRTIDTEPKVPVVDAFTLEELRKATENFSSSNLIEGSFFHGWLNGKNFAIKQTKVETISKIELKLFHSTHHPNLVQLLGTCSDKDCNSYLVFEYAKNGSLKDWLHGGLAIKNQFIASCYCFLTWSQRLRISLHVARGLKYMHCELNPSYVHKDIKSKNIFLDEEFNAKIARFGMRDCIEDSLDMDLPSAESSSWAKGYLAPEFLQNGTIDPRIDIYAYGVVLLEVLSGKTPITRATKKGEIILLSEQIKSVLDSDLEGNLRHWMDTALGESYPFDAALTLANLARACVEEDPSLRPGAEEITEKLEVMVEDLPGEKVSRIGLQGGNRALLKFKCEYGDSHRKIMLIFKKRRNLSALFSISYEFSYFDFQ